MWKKFLIAIAATFIIVTILITLPSDSGQSTLGSDGSLPYLSTTRKANIKNAWLKYHPELPGWDLDFPYYGTYNGYDVLLIRNESTGYQKVQIGRIMFSNNFSFLLVAHSNNTFYPLKQLYDNGQISDEAIAAAAKIHNIYRTE